MTIPPFAFTAGSTLSGTLRGCGLTARTPEWLNITGACEVSSASFIVASLTWLRSTIMPMRFISRTTCRPKSVSPSCAGASVAASAQLRFFEWVSVM